ncbi:ComF family protein [Salibacterium halotolerans]|uniref:Competence protein ComFC n=1 Tax=Salibacterium halotolerans TaxID=1884432 RepID=A0A1I5WY87_9BACI|nr:ComF family protein [Salibacterium halotolerans]SFQ24608.1 competence protein ComFC [Salibacterium halotolerans]
MTECLYCGNADVSAASWKTLLWPEDSGLCQSCQLLFTPIQEPVCEMCGRPLEHIGRCVDCERWETDPHWKGTLRRNVSLFPYDDVMKEWTALWKYRGDAVLAESFRSRIRQLYLTHAAGAVPVPLPLSRERLQERGFNQAAILASFTAAPGFSLRRTPAPADILIRTTHEEKQSKKSRAERMSSASRPFTLKVDKKDVEGKHFVLYDDIYTTGSTLRKAALPLIENGAADVCSITLIRG